MAKTKEILECAIKMHDQASSVLDRVNLGFKSLVQSVELLNKSMGLMDGGRKGLNAVDRKMNQIQQTITTANNHINTMNTCVGVLELQLLEARSRAQEFERQLADSRTRAQELERELLDSRTRTQELTQQLDEMRRRMEGLTRNQSQFTSKCRRQL